MKKTFIGISVIAIIGLFLMGCTAPKTTAKTGATKAAVICPVTGTKLTKEKAFETMEYKGKTYYFCCAECKPTFEKDPEKYIASGNVQMEHDGMMMDEKDMKTNTMPKK